MVEIYDCANLSVTSLTFGAGKSGLMMLKRVLSIGQGHYPENLRTALFINAPLGFASAWSLVSSVLAERLLSKAMRMARRRGRAASWAHECLMTLEST